MTEIERKALALLDEVQGERSHLPVDAPNYQTNAYVALCRAIEQHEAFRQEVSDALLRYHAPTHVPHGLQDLIIPKPKPDPLVDVLHEVDTGPEWDSPEDYCNKIRAALEARGLEIREKSEHD